MKIRIFPESSNFSIFSDKDNIEEIWGWGESEVARASSSSDIILKSRLWALSRSGPDKEMVHMSTLRFG